MKDSPGLTAAPDTSFIDKGFIGNERMVTRECLRLEKSEKNSLEVLSLDCPRPGKIVLIIA